MYELTREKAREIKRMNRKELENWLQGFYQEAFSKGYQEGLHYPARVETSGYIDTIGEEKDGRFV